MTQLCTLGLVAAFPAVSPAWPVALDHAYGAGRQMPRIDRCFDWLCRAVRGWPSTAALRAGQPRGGLGHIKLRLRAGVLSQGAIDQVRMIFGKRAITASRRRLSNAIGGLAALLVFSVIGGLSSEAVGAELPIPAKQAVQPAPSMQRTCVGTDGKAFRWDQPNAPFASTCSFDKDGPATANPAPK